MTLPAPPPPGFEAFAAAAAAGAAGVAWFGTERELRAVLAAWRPEATLHAASAAGDWDALLADASKPADLLVWRSVQDQHRELRARLAVAEVGATSLSVFLRPMLLPPGFWAIDPAPDADADVAPPPAPTLDDLAYGRAPAAALVAHAADPAVLDRRLDIAEQISRGLVDPEPRRRILIGPALHRLTDHDAAIWADLPRLDPADLPRLHWPAVLRHPHLVIGLVRAARRDPSGELWRALARRVSEFPFRAPALDWARRAHRHQPTPEMETLLCQRYQEVLRLGLERMDVRGVAALLDRWERDEPDGPAPIKRLLVADAWNDDATVLAVDPGAFAPANPALRAEVLRLQARAHQRCGDPAAAEAVLHEALALERDAGLARDLGAWASLVHRHGPPQPAPGGGTVTRAHLADLLRRRGALEAAAELLAGLDQAPRPEPWLASARLAEAAGAPDVAEARFEHAVTIAQTTLDEANARLARAAFHRRLGACDAARAEAVHAWGLAMSGVPAVRRLAIGLAAWDLVEAVDRPAIAEEVALAIDDAPPTLRAVTEWKRRM